MLLCHAIAQITRTGRHQQQQAAFFKAVMKSNGDTTNAQSKDLARHPCVPVIFAHNDFVRQTLWAVKGSLDNMG
eukprot:11592887-Ditylum_brightwellii.AAC.1